MQAVIALGSNLGDRHTNLAAGIEGLQELGVVRVSSLIMETQDESGRGPDYLNTVALLITEIEDPPRLLEALLRTELRCGRDRSQGRNAPRTLDLDLIAVSGQTGTWTWETPEDLRLLGSQLHLELPHPRAFTRPFVLEPWRALTDPGDCGGVIPGTHPSA